jgi:hypothetical protein
MMVENTAVGDRGITYIVNFGKCSPVILFATKTTRATEFLILLIILYYKLLQKNILFKRSLF